MLKSDEILNSLNLKLKNIDNVEDLKEKENLLNECKTLKAEYRDALESEKKENLEIEMKGGIINMNNEMVELRAKEEKQFVDYIKGIKNEGMTAGNNGAIIPATISERIIKKVFEVSPILERMTRFNEGGDLVFVRELNAVPVAYQEEMVAFTGGDAQFETVKLQDFLVGALAKVSKSLINRASFDVVGYVVDIMGRDIAKFLENECLNSAGLKIRGLADAKNVQVTKIDADACIDAIMAIPSLYQEGAVFIMHPEVLAGLRKAKDGQGGYLLNQDPRNAFGMQIMGHEVLISEQAPKNAFFFGNLRGVYAKYAQNMEVEVLRERFADMYAVGVIAYAQVDIKVVEPQAMVKVTIVG